MTIPLLLDTDSFLRGHRSCVDLLEDPGNCPVSSAWTLLESSITLQFRGKARWPPRLTRPISKKLYLASTSMAFGERASDGEVVVVGSPGMTSISICQRPRTYKARGA